MEPTTTPTQFTNQDRELLNSIAARLIAIEKDIKFADDYRNRKLIKRAKQ